MNVVSQKPRFIIYAFSALSVLSLYQAMFVVDAFAQSDQGILIRIVNSSFAPLTTVEGNQVRISVMYQVNDGSLEDEKINGIMKIYSENGTLVHSSSFPEGFIAKKKGGTEVFRTTIRDPAVNNLLANVTFIDFARQGTLSNTVTANLSLQTNNTEQTNSTDPSSVLNEAEQEVSNEAEQELEPEQESVFTEQEQNSQDEEEEEE
jgi:hypothetical protein